MATSDIETPLDTRLRDQNPVEDLNQFHFDLESFGTNQHQHGTENPSHSNLQSHFLLEVDKDEDHNVMMVDMLLPSTHAHTDDQYSQLYQICSSGSNLQSVWDISNGMLHTPLNQNQMGQKRKPEQASAEFDDGSNISLHLYHLTLSKLLSSPPRRVEPPLQRSVVMRNTLKHLECGLFSQTPCKRIFLDLDEPAALNDLHLSSDVSDMSVTSEQDQLDTKMDKILPVTADTDSMDQSDSEYSNTDRISKQDYINLLPARLSQSSNCAYNPKQSTSTKESNLGEKMDFTDSPLLIASQNCGAESLEKSKYSNFPELEYQSLMSCSMDQYSLREPASGKTTPTSHPHIDELDNIMQVLVGM